MSIRTGMGRPSQNCMMLLALPGEWTKRGLMEVEIVLACYHRKIVGVFEVEQWVSAAHPVFAGFHPNPDDKRYGFIGHEAPACIADHYVGKRVSHNVKTGRGSFGYVPREKK